MLAHADPSQVAGLSRFFKTGPGQYGEGDRFLGIKVPVTREVVKSCWQSVGRAELEECIGSKYHEVRLAALLSLVEIFRHSGKRPRSVTPLNVVRICKGADIGQPGASGADEEYPGASGAGVAVQRNGAAKNGSVMSKEECVRFYLEHTSGINNWDLVDLSCYSLLGEWLLDKDRTLLYDLARNGRTIWEQRIGMVSTMTFIRHGQLDDTFAIADILLHHTHDLIHKAVGWLLREAGKKDKHALEAYLKGDGGSGQRYLAMPRTMLRYAVEKFPEAERKAYLAGEAR